VSDPVGEVIKKGFQRLDRLSSNTAFPYDANAPASLSEKAESAFVVHAVPLNFGRPICRVRRGRFEELAGLVPVPEAAVNLNDCMVLREHQVGPAGQLADMQAESKSTRENTLPYRHFWLGVPALDARHYPTTGFRVYFIHWERGLRCFAPDARCPCSDRIR
jgi:hypothetical protein